MSSERNLAEEENNSTLLATSLQNKSYRIKFLLQIQMSITQNGKPF